MKKKFLTVLSLLLILIPISYSIESNPVSESISMDQFLNQYTITELVKMQYDAMKSKQLSEDQINKLKAALPVSLKLNITDTNETIFVEVTKKGEVLMPESMSKTDFEIITTRQEFLSLLESEKIDASSLKPLIESDKIMIKTYSLKSEIYIQIMEDKLKFNIVKHKGFRARTIGFIAGKIAGMFVPNQQ